MNAATQDARPSGPEIRQQVFGAPTAKPTAPGGGDPFLGPFFQTAIEHVWGGIWNRPGLELKYRSPPPPVTTRSSRRTCAAP